MLFVKRLLKKSLPPGKVIPSVVEGSQKWAKSAIWRFFASLRMTEE